MKKKTIITVITVVLVVLGAGLIVLPELNKNRINGDISDENMVFFEGSAIHVSGFDYDEGFKPTIEEARAGIEKIKKYLQNSPKDSYEPNDSWLRNYYKESSKSICEQFCNFKVQCTGYKKAGQKYVHYQFFKDESIKDWKTNEIMVMDGGWNYWHAMYDVNKKRVYDLVINGVG